MRHRNKNGSHSGCRIHFWREWFLMMGSRMSVIASRDERDEVALRAISRLSNTGGR